MIPRPARALLTVAVALVWLYQGLWHKVLQVSEAHLSIVRHSFGDRLGPVVLHGLGGIETALAIAVLLHWRSIPVAWMQIGLLVAMNTIALFTAAGEIPDIGGMLTTNLVFGTTVWINGRLQLSP